MKSHAGQQTLFDMPPESSGSTAPPLPAGTPLARYIEQEFKRRSIPYVDVDEAKKALFSAARLKTFHFCVYAPEGSNWLLLCDEAGESNRRDMEEWQAIFGDGFKAVFAVERKAGIVFKTLADERVSLDDLSPEKPTEIDQRTPARARAKEEAAVEAEVRTP